MTVTPTTIDAILAGVVLELFAIRAVLVRASAAAWLAPAFLTLAAGAALLVGLRLALAGAAPPWIGGALLASLLAHVGSLVVLHRRLPRPEAG